MTSAWGFYVLDPDRDGPRLEQVARLAATEAARTEPAPSEIDWAADDSVQPARGAAAQLH